MLLREHPLEINIKLRFNHWSHKDYSILYYAPAFMGFGCQWRDRKLLDFIKKKTFVFRR